MILLFNHNFILYSFKRVNDDQSVALNVLVLLQQVVIHNDLHDMFNSEVISSFKFNNSSFLGSWINNNKINESQYISTIYFFLIYNNKVLKCFREFIQFDIQIIELLELVDQILVVHYILRVFGFNCVFKSTYINNRINDLFPA